MRKFICCVFLFFTGAAYASLGEFPERKLMDDLHIHAGGSYPLEVLKTVAEKNNKMHLFTQFQEGYALLKGKSLDIKQRLELIAQQFGIVGQIMSDIEDVEYGTAAIIRNHPSDYLELRSSLKRLGEYSLKDYAEAFARGIREVNEELGKVKALGLLSIDRTRHCIEEAKEIIQIALELRSKGRPIAGIDISGLPGFKRTIEPNQLIEILRLCLDNGLPIAIHLGEADDDFEFKDTNAVLEFLRMEYNIKANRDVNYFRGIIRLGHVIYTTDIQRNRIRKLNLAIEICPTCHEQAGWWDGGAVHSVYQVYPQDSGAMRVCYGSDDPSIFCIEDIRDDMQRFQNLVGSNQPIPEDRFDWGVNFEADYKQLTEHEQQQLRIMQGSLGHGYNLGSLSARLLTFIFAWNLVQK